MAESLRILSLMIKPPVYVAAKIHALPWVDPDRGAHLLHQTVLPIGDRAVVGCDLDGIVEAICKLDAMPFEARFDKVVAVPGYAAKLVPSGSQPAQRRLFRSVFSAVKGSGFEPLPYKFKPHVTLHYHSPELAFKLDVEPVGWLVDALLLVESFHGERRHEELCRWPLRPRQGTLFPFLSCTMPLARAA